MSEAPLIVPIGWTGTTEVGKATGPSSWLSGDLQASGLVLFVGNFADRDNDSDRIRSQSLNE